MKAIRRLSLLIALALLVTVGGVYATWAYAGASASESHQHMSINLESASTTASEGVIHSVMNTLNVLIDDTNRDYNADLVITGSMGFVFTPNSGAASDVVTNGIPMQWELEQTDPGVQYKGSNIFTITQASAEALTSTKITDANAATLCSEDLSGYIGGFYVEVTAANVSDVLTVDLRLPNHTEYTAFKSELGSTSGKLGITVSKGSGT